MAGFTADPGGLQLTAPLYGSQASDLAAIHARLVAGLEAEGACWGSDEPSTAGGVYRWGQNYLDADEAVQAGLSGQPGA